MSSIIGLITNSALTAVENKIPDVSNSVQKNTLQRKKQTLNLGYNRFTTNIVVNNIKSKDLVDKSDVAGFINNADLDKIVANINNKS